MAKPIDCLIEAMKTGKAAVFSATDDRVVAAADLREVLLRFADAAGAGAPDTLGARLVLEGAEIDGRVDLDDTARTDGRPHPSVTFLACRFSGGVSLRHSHLRRLAFRNCTFRDTPEGLPTLDISGCELESDFELVSCSPDDGHAFWVTAANTRIDGAVVLERTRLICPEPRSREEIGLFPRFALDLTGAHILNDIVLMPGFTASGGVGLRSARVGGSVRARGAALKAGELTAFDARMAEFNGDVAFQADVFSSAKLIRSIIDGSMWFDGSTINGSLAFSAARIGWRHDHPTGRETNWTAICLNNTAIGGNLYLDAVVSDQGAERTDLFGNLEAFALRVGGYAMMGGLAVLRAGSLDEASADYSVFPLPSVTLLHADITADLAWEPVVDFKRRIVAPPVCAGVIHLDKATVGRIRMDNVEFRTSIPGFTRLSAVGLRCDGDLWLSSRGSGNFDLSQSTIAGTLDLSRFSVNAGDHGSGIARAPQLKLRDATVAHGILLSAARTTTLSLMRVRTRALRIYGGATLVEALWKSTSGEEIRVFQSGHLVMPGGGIITLNGQSVIFHALNQQTSATYDTIEKATDYARVFFAYVWSDEGAFLIRADEGQTEPDLVLERDGEGWKGVTTIDYGIARFRSDISLEVGGLFRMLGDEPITEDWAVLPPRFEPPFIYAWEPADAWPRPPAFTDMVDEAADAWEARLRPLISLTGRLSKAWIDLTDASCATLNDDGGRAWPDDCRLMLNRFTYSQQASYDVDNSAEGKQTLALSRKRWLELQLDPADRRSDFKLRPKNPESFSVQPIAQMISVLRQEGEEHAAIRLEILKRNTEGWVQAMTGPGWLKPAMLMANALGHTTMGHLLDPIRATITTFVLIVVGALAVIGAETREVIMLDTMPVASVYLDAAPGGAATPIAAGTEAKREIPCGDAINPVLYAADIFIPLVDLRQESQCSVNVSARNGEGLAWAFGKALYAVLGWLVISLTIITFTNVARRRGEQGG